MRARWGIAWLVAASWLVLVICTPLPGWAAGDDSGQSSAGWRPSIFLAAAQSSMEAQMLGEKSSPPARPGASLLQEVTSPLHPGAAGSTVRLPYNLEMNISVHYNRDPSSPPELKRFSDSPLLMKYSMDYRLLSNLQVGLNSYLYRPDEDPFYLQRQGNRLGFGSELKYNLGQWNFLLKSQVQTAGNRDRGDGLQNWFRVWYAF